VPVAGENGKSGVFGEPGIVERKFAEDERGTAGRFDPARVNAVSTEAGGIAVIHSALFLLHERSISQEAAIADARESWMWIRTRSGHRIPET
jgi:hypothetical protein